jgi:hypothetical protein
MGVAGGCGLRWGEATGLCLDALDLDRGTLRVIRTVIEVAGHTSFKPYPKSTAGRRTVPLPGWLVIILRAHLDRYPLGEGDLLFANEVGGALRRTLFRSRVWRPSLVRAGLLGSVAPDGDAHLAHWIDATGKTAPTALRHRAGGREARRTRARRRAALPRPPPLLRHVACRRRRAAQHGPAGDRARTLVDDAQGSSVLARPVCCRPSGTRRRTLDDRCTWSSAATAGKRQPELPPDLGHAVCRLPSSPWSEATCAARLMRCTDGRSTLTTTGPRSAVRGRFTGIIRSIQPPPRTERVAVTTVRPGR